MTQNFADSKKKHTQKKIVIVNGNSLREKYKKIKEKTKKKTFLKKKSLIT